MTKDFYGVGLMAGPFPEIQDEMSGVLWSQGADWLTDEGVVPVDAVEKAMNDYLALMPFAPPAALTVTYDGVMNQMKDGQIAQTYSFFLDQWPNAVTTEQSVPGAKMGVAEAPEKKAYIGGFLLGVSASSAHPEEAMDFVAYIGGHDAQMEFAKAGGTSTLMSVLSDPAFATPESRSKTGHFATLLEIFNSMDGFRSNLFDTPFGAKIYNTMQIPLQSAASGQITARQAAEQLAAEVDKICGGPCPIAKPVERLDLRRVPFGGRGPLSCGARPMSSIPLQSPGQAKPFSAAPAAISDRSFSILLIAPAMAVIRIFAVLPLGYAVDGLLPLRRPDPRAALRDFVGLDNYRSVLFDRGLLGFDRRHARNSPSPPWRSGDGARHRHRLPPPRRHPRQEHHPLAPDPAARHRPRP